MVSTCFEMSFIKRSYDVLSCDIIMICDVMSHGVIFMMSCNVIYYDVL